MERLAVRAINELKAGIGKIRMEHRKILNFKHIRKTKTIGKAVTFVVGS